MLQRSSSPISLGSRSPRTIHMDRLLDPAYSSTPYASTSAYVDPHGELHDPDYRQFPVSQPKRRTSNYTIPSRPRWETFDEEEDDADIQEFSPARRTTSFSSYQHTRPTYAYTYTPSYIVPHSYDSGDTEIDEEEADAFGSTTKSHTVSRIISRTKEFTRKRRSLDGASRKSTDSAPNSPFFSPSSLPDTPTTPASSSDSPDDRRPLSRTLSHHSEPERVTSFTPLYSISTSTYHRHSRSQTYTHNEPSSHAAPAYTPSQDVDRETSWTPTCAQALRRQWQAVSLRIRFGVFRAQRRWKNRLAMR